MSVTELAFLPLLQSEITTDIKADFNSGLDVQDGWCNSHLPTMPKGREPRGVGFFQQIEDPKWLLLTAHWESVDQHGQWIASDENKSIMGDLVKFIVIDKVFHFHLADSEIFAAGQSDAKGLLESPVISVGRLSVESTQRDAFQKKWEEVKTIVEDYAKPHTVNGAWRIENQDEDVDEFVMFVGWDSVDQHMGFAKSDEFPKYAEIRDLAKSAESKHYRRFL